MGDAYKDISCPPGAEADQAGLAVVIVTFNSVRALPGLLNSLPEGLQGIDRFEIIVADNDFVDGQPNWQNPIRYVQQSSGWAATRAMPRQSMRQRPACTRIPICLILNPDLRLYPGAVRPLIEHVAKPSVGIAVPRNYKEDGTADPTLRREPSLLTAWADALLGGTLATRIGWGEIVGDPLRPMRIDRMGDRLGIAGFGTRTTRCRRVGRIVFSLQRGSGLSAKGPARQASTSSTIHGRRSCMKAGKAA